MRNIWMLFRDDCKRLFTNVVSVVIAVGLVVMPSIFAWYNVMACWNVFDNTGNLRVAVANVDEGYESDLFPLRVNVGEQVIAALRANDEIDWTFTTEEDAIDGAKSGRYYAAVVIPKGFSRDMLTFYADDARHANIVYYANEKKSAIAPKITDKGADSVSYQVNEVFAETLSELTLAIAESVTAYADESDLSGTVGKLSDHVRATADQMDRAAGVMVLYGELSASSQQLVDDSAELVRATQGQADDLAAKASEGASSITGTVEAIKSSGADLSSAIGASAESFDAVGNNVDALFDTASGNAANTVQRLRDEAAAVDGQVARYQAVVDELSGLRGSVPAEMKDLAAALDRSIAMAQGARDMVASVRDGLRDAADKLESGDADVQAERESIKQGAAEAESSISELKADFDAKLQPGLRELADDAAAFSADATEGLARLDAAGTDLSGSMDSVGEKLGGAQASIDESSENLHAAADELRGVAERIDAALAAGDTDALADVLGSDVEGLSKALAAPVGVERIAVFPSENFGSAMAPLYTTLALFIGSLLILVVVKPKPSERARRALDDPKPRQLFLGRFGVMAVLSLAQTTLMGLGNMLFLQVQVAHPFLFMLCFWTAGLVFTFVIYALVASFANLGKAMAVLLLIIQVTGCGGSFPLQILPGFVQGLSPYLPATHVVNAMREAMMGTTGGVYWEQLGELLLFAVPAALLGLVLRKPLERFMDWYVEQVESSKLVG